jgi:hypothetical protein
MILKKQPIQKVYANNLTSKNQLNPSGSANICVVTELQAEPILKNTEFEDNICDINIDDEQIPESKIENPNISIQTPLQPAVGKPPQPTAAKQATPVIQKQIQRIILFKESKLTKFSK